MLPPVLGLFATRVFADFMVLFFGGFVVLVLGSGFWVWILIVDLGFDFGSRLMVGVSLCEFVWRLGDTFGGTLDFFG